VARVSSRRSAGASDAEAMGVLPASRRSHATRRRPCHLTGRGGSAVSAIAAELGDRVANQVSGVLLAVDDVWEVLLASIDRTAAPRLVPRSSPSFSRWNSGEAAEVGHEFGFIARLINEGSTIAFSAPARSARRSAAQAVGALLNPQSALRSPAQDLWVGLLELSAMWTVVPLA